MLKSIELESHNSGVLRILQMFKHILFCVCVGRLGVGVGNFHPPHKEKWAREVYALRFVRTSSYASA